MTRFSEQEMLSTLGDGDVARYFVIDGLIMSMEKTAHDPEGELMALVIEDDALNVACIEYLVGKGAQVYESFEEYEAHNRGKP